MTRRVGDWISTIAAGVILAACVVRLDVKQPAGGFGHMVLAQELVAAFGAALLVVAAGVARLPVARDRVNALVGALVATEVVSLSFAANRWIAARAGGLLLAGAATFIVARSSASRRNAMSSLFMVPLAVVAVAVLLEATGMVVGLSRTGHAPGGLLAERNAASELLVCGLPLVAWHAVSESTRARALALVTAVVSAAAIACTRTRSAWLAGIVLAALGLALALRGSDADRRRGGVLALVVALGVGLAPWISALRWASASPFTDTVRHLVDASSVSGHGRLVQYATTWKMALAHPLLGVGPGNWAGSYPSFASPSDPTVGGGPWPTNRLPNSDLLGFVSERGLVAAAVAVVLIWLAARPGPYAWLRRATIVAWLVVGSLDAVLQLAPHLLFVAWVLGSAMPNAPTSSRGPARLSHGFVALVLVASGVLGVQRARSFRIAVMPYGIEDLERAARLDPGDVSVRLRVAADWIENDRCDRAAPHLAAVRAYSPASPMLKELDARCRISEAR